MRRDNVVEFVARWKALFGTLQWEVLFVDDDSPAYTSDLVRHLAPVEISCQMRAANRAAACHALLSKASRYLVSLHWRHRAHLTAELGGEQHHRRVLLSVCESRGFAARTLLRV